MKNFIWALIEQVGSQLINVLITIILAVFIAPNEFGVFTIITIIASLSYLFINLGFGKSLIKKTKPTDDDKNTVFLINLSIALAFSAILILSAKYISLFFNYGDLESYLYWIPLGFIFSSLGQVNLALLTKALKFKQIFIGYLLSRIISGIIAIYFAFAGFGVWSLVIQQITSSFLQTAFTFYFENWIPKFYFSSKSYKELAGFSFNVFGTELVNYIVDNLDKIIIGKFLQQNVLGLYTRAYQLTMLPVQNFPRVVDKFLFPYLSKENLNSEDLANFYVKIIGVISYVLFPIIITFSVVSDDFVSTLFTNEWSSLSPLIKVIAFSAIFVSLSELNTSFFLTTNHTRQLFVINITTRSLTIISLFPAISFGIEGVVWAMVGCNALRMITLSYFNLRFLRYSLMKCLNSISFTLIITIVSVIITEFLAYSFNLQIGLLRLIFKTLSIFVFYFSLSYLIGYNQFIFLRDVILRKRNLFE